SHSVEAFAIEYRQAAIIGPAQKQRLFDDRVEDGGKVARRGVDDLQYLSGRDLLLQCFAGLGQKPRILHCNDCLRREIFEERYLFVREWPHFPPVGSDDAEQPAVLPQRHEQLSSNPDLNEGLYEWQPLG